MRCVRCGRRLSLAKVTVTTRAGQSSWGPVCARKAGLVVPSARSGRAIRTTKVKRDEDVSQMTLELICET